MSSTWSSESTPILEDDGSNASMWRQIVRIVAEQHQAEELLVREPQNAVEMEQAKNMKRFLSETCGTTFQPALITLTALRAWKYLQIAVDAPISPEFSPIQKPIPTHVAAKHAADMQELRVDSGMLPRITQDMAQHGRLQRTSNLEPPENYPVRDESVVWEDIDKTVKEEEDEELSNRASSGVLVRSSSAPAKLQFTKTEQLKPEVTISPFRASSGRRRAVLCGINYSGQEELRGCVRDTVFLTHLLRTRFGFKANEIFVLTDEPHGMDGINSGKPTRRNIEEAMTWLMRDARQGDSLFFSFSGHGGQQQDFNGDEKNGMDDTICPVDFLECGEILDDQLYEMLVKRVPKGARLTAVIDSCSSGTVLDLPYAYDINTGIRYDERTIIDDKEEEEEEEETPSRLKRLLRKLRLRRKRAEEEQETCSLCSESCYCSPVQEPAKYAPRGDSKGGEVLLFSGCQDGKTSLESSIAEKGAGLMTYSFVDVIERGLYQDWHNYTYRSLMKAIQHKVMAWSDGQDPQFSTSHPFNLDSPFML